MKKNLFHSSSDLQPTTTSLRKTKLLVPGAIIPDTIIPIIQQRWIRQRAQRF